MKKFVVKSSFHLETEAIFKKNFFHFSVSHLFFTLENGINRNVENIIGNLV